jgi:hypothetical protein
VVADYLIRGDAVNVRKITISISEELAYQADRWKDDYNPSELYQEALRDFIHKKEELEERMRGASDLNQIVERLKKQKRIAEANFFEHGKQKGLVWAQSADYTELHYAVTSLDSLVKRATGIDGERFRAHHILANTILGKYFDKIFRDNNLIWPAKTPFDVYFNRDGKKFLEGWCEAVEDFWKEISPKLNHY